jgi:flagellin-like protein
MSGSSKRRGVSPVIATLLLIAIAVAAAVILYAFVTGFLGNVTKGGPSYLVTGNGQMVVPGSTSLTGILSLTLRNEGSEPINGVAVACPSPPFSTVNCGGFIFTYGGNQILPGNLLPVGALGTGAVGVTAAAAPGFTAGTSYQVTVTMTFVGGSTQIILISVPSTS